MFKTFKKRKKEKKKTNSDMSSIEAVNRNIFKLLNIFSSNSLKAAGTFPFLII